MNANRVWIRKRTLKSGKVSYHLRWICPVEHRWQSRKVGTDRRRADQEAALLQRQLDEGTYRAIRKTTWAAFVDDVVAFLPGEQHSKMCRDVLHEFAEVCHPTSPRTVRPTMIRQYVQRCRDKGNAVATVNKKLRYLRLTFRTAVRMEVAAVNPVDGWTWDKVPKREHRILTRDEETKLLKSAQDYGGLKLETFVTFALETWGRRGELLGLSWDDVRFDDHCVYFRSTKSHEDRFVPIAPESGLWSALRKLQAQTLQDGGPFRAIADTPRVLWDRWNAVVKGAGIGHITLHDLRRTGITRALLAGMPAVAVRAIAGHASLSTTEKYYLQVSRRDLCEAVAKLHAAG